MSSETSITVKNISKCFHIYERPQHRLLQMLWRGRKQFGREFWAVDDVSFEIKKGETFGIIGRNGSGKSTLLQMICGVLNPTSGKVTTHGRIAALLELGSGFNPEFTGRENIYMNASILGLKTEEIDNRFDDIVAFADIGEFIEQPVKIYSNGMFVRLAFAVIAHVDADILVIDEALAVGDAVFTQKCMHFIRRFKEKGTLVLVSHDMSSVSNLCQNAAWLDKGKIKMINKSTIVAQNYLQDTLQSVYGNEVDLQTLDNSSTINSISGDCGELTLSDPEAKSMFDYSSTYTITNNLETAKGFKTGKSELTSIEIENLTNPGETLLKGGERVRVSVRARANQSLDRPILGFVFHDRLGQALFGENTLPFTDKFPMQVAAGQSFWADFTFRLPMLPNGEYVVFSSVAEGELYENTQHHLLHDALTVKVSSSKVRWGLVGIPFEQVEMKVCL
ncbi:MAG: ABC transporter ATP-binding protein [Legionella sp.]|uniref:ABC transporter ATP-binding protein n=1 Tax=Legionella sp. TaxID=459 RepID=UPI0039E5B47C